MRRLAWGGHASLPLVVAIAALHALVVLWMCSSWQRLRLVMFDFREVPNESFMTMPPDDLRALGYTEDDGTALAAFRDVATPIVQGAQSDRERMRRLGDYIYSLRRTGQAEPESQRREASSSVFARTRMGQAGNCAQMSIVLSAFWRSLGGHVRRVQWTTVEGAVGHVAVELYSDSYRRWMYYDMNVNGYFKDDDGTPLSIASVRANLLTDEALYVVANDDPRFHDWTKKEFQTALQDFPVEWYALNNSLAAFEPDVRFGPLNPLYRILSRLPTPLDAIADNLTGARDRRLVVDGKVQIGNLLTFDGARLLLGWCLAVLAVCAGTLLRFARRQSGESSAGIPSSSARL